MTNDLNQLIQNHPRDFQSQRYVYPVISRRSRGISIGVNLSPTGLCNFHCVYCQVGGEMCPSDGKNGHVTTKSLSEISLGLADKYSLNDHLLPEYSSDMVKHCHVRSNDSNQSIAIDLDVLASELRETLVLAVSGELFKVGAFQKTPPPFRRINDIAFSGNGEPTLAPQFADAVQVVLRVRDELEAVDVKPVLITNATMMQKPNVAESVEQMVDRGGEVWAKLDAGSQEYYQQVSRSHVPFSTIVDNIGKAAKRHPVVIQTMFLKIHGEPLPEAELMAYVDRLNEMTQQGGRIKLVQLYTIIRKTAEPWVSPLTNRQLDTFANRIRNETNLEVESYSDG